MVEDTIVAYNISSWRMKCSLDDTTPACHSLTNVAIDLGDKSESITYIRRNNHIGQSHLVSL